MAGRPKKRPNLSAEQKRVLAAAIRSKLNPLNAYEPGKTQKECFESDALYRALTGVNRGGKTFHCCVELAHILRGTHPTRSIETNMEGVYAVPSRLQCAKTQGRYLLQECRMKGDHLPPEISKVPLLRPEEVEVVWDKSAKPPCPRSIKHKETGNTVTFIWSDAAKADSKLQGMSFHFALIDETAGTQAFLDELFPRLLDNNGWVLWTVTQTKVNMAMEAFLAKCRSEQMPDYALFTIPPNENPAVSKEARERMGANLSQEAREIRMEGTSSALSNVLIYPQLSAHQEKYVRKDAYVPLEDDNYWIGYDPGVDHPSGITFAAISRVHPRKLHILHSIIEQRMSISYEIDLMRAWLDGRKLAGFVYDPCGAGRAEKGTGKSVIQQIAERMQDASWWASGQPSFFRPNPKHNHGIACVRSYLDPRLDEYPEPLIEWDKPTPENGLDLALGQLSTYRGREDLDFVGARGVVKKNDEHADTIRYLCMVGPSWKDYGPNVATGATYSPMARPERIGGPLPVTPEQAQAYRRKQMSAAVAKRHRGQKRRIRY